MTPMEKRLLLGLRFQPGQSCTVAVLKGAYCHLFPGMDGDAFQHTLIGLDQDGLIVLPSDLEGRVELTPKGSALAGMLLIEK